MRMNDHAERLTTPRGMECSTRFGDGLSGVRNQSSKRFVTVLVHAEVLGVLMDLGRWAWRTKPRRPESGSSTKDASEHVHLFFV